MYFVHFAFSGLFVGYNENGSTNSVKVMSHVEKLLWAMDHPPSIKMYVISFCKMVHSRMWYINDMPGGMTHGG